MQTAEAENKAETLGRRVASRRALKGWTQRELGDAVGIHPMQVSRIEVGESMPSVPTLVALSRVFGVTLDWLVHGEQHAQAAVA